MSWSISLVGKPKNVVEALAEHAATLDGNCKAEFCTALPHLTSLVEQNYSKEDNVIVHLTASGHASRDTDNAPQYSSCAVELRNFGAKLVALLLMCLCATQAFAQGQAPVPDQVDVREVIRRGDCVQELGTGIRGDEDEVGDALDPPEDDSHKWYISLITSANCPACERLKKDFLENKTLRAWVDVESPDDSWAHYAVYRWEDETQHKRFEKIKIKAFPTIIVQPPRSAEYGPSSTVVFQKTGYNGDAEKLSQEMSKAIKAYVTAYKNRVKERSIAKKGVGQVGVDPPFDVGPKVDPRYPQGPVPSVDIPSSPGATLEELRRSIPDADSEFLLQQLNAHASLEQAMMAWQIAHPKAPEFYYVPHIASFLGGILVASMFFGLFVLFFVGARFALRNSRVSLRPNAAPTV